MTHTTWQSLHFHWPLTLVRNSEMPCVRRGSAQIESMSVATPRPATFHTLGGNSRVFRKYLQEYCVFFKSEKIFVISSLNSIGRNVLEFKFIKKQLSSSAILAQLLRRTASCLKNIPRLLSCQLYFSAQIIEFIKYSRNY